MKIRLLSLALPHIKGYLVAVDCGAYEGEWTGPLCEKFDRVYAFEPQTEYASLLTIKFPNAIVVNAALMDHPGVGVFIIPPRTQKVRYTDRSATVIREAAGKIPIVRLDDFQIKGCGLIKMNVEGCEPFVLDGAKRLLKLDAPVIIMEESNPKKLPDEYKQSPRRARLLLENLGYHQVVRDNHDTIWTKKVL